ncbi:uncharacterized protein I206_101743 [Kwoniella pini CBS 10737]|uniref:Transmembrane protein 14 n=1 Tax=Kwoniella pini CBS 10737 TaxID=1296096 RepID=A0A1B9HVV7_9TREE|nr:uncharacterized protein I206_06287 [Kwoniella pini CBS 10737]OCF47391.1 hypothetical protein I206_06287 [Kwoniella pini CBS 10737]
MAPLFATSPDYLGYGYAGLLIVGGLMGGLKRGSKMSLIAGGASGLLAGYGANRVSNNPTDTIPSLATASTLLILMGYRFYQSKKFMPAGLVATLSLLMAIRYYNLKP